MADASVGLDKVDLANKIIKAGNISLSGTNLIFRQDKNPETAKPAQKSSSPSFPWDVNAGSIDLEDIGSAWVTTATHFNIRSK